MVYPDKNEDENHGSLKGDANESGAKSHIGYVEPDAIAPKTHDTVALSSFLNDGLSVSAAQTQDRCSSDTGIWVLCRSWVVRKPIGSWLEANMVDQHPNEALPASEI